MQSRQAFPAFLTAVLVVMTSVAMAQEDGKEGQETKSEAEAEDGIRMSIVHKGPGRTRDGLAALFPDQVRELEVDSDTFKGLFLAQETPEQQGGAVIIADTGRSAAHGLAGGAAPGPAGIRMEHPEHWSAIRHD